MGAEKGKIFPVLTSNTIKFLKQKVEQQGNQQEQMQRAMLPASHSAGHVLSLMTPPQTLLKERAFLAQLAETALAS